MSTDKLRRSWPVRLVRFLAWICVAIGALILASTVTTYAPCFMGVPDSCISGVLLLFGVAAVLLFCGVGAGLLFLTRRR